MNNTNITKTDNEVKQKMFLTHGDDFSDQPAPVEYYVKNWIRKNGLQMIHGPSGGGKTFTVLDICLRIASGVEEWMGITVRPANVLYLAGEGHNGLRGRIAAWKAAHGIDRLNLWVSNEACDLNTPLGYDRVIQSIDHTGDKPGVIIVDTLHRFMLGDENSAQDSKTMIDACQALISRYDCCVILIHHTGLSQNAQDRARGSSAWKGALDIEMNISPAKDGKPIRIRQVKNKDEELQKTIPACLSPVVIPGWFDEDGDPVSSAVLSRAPVSVDPVEEAKGGSSDEFDY